MSVLPDLFRSFKQLIVWSVVVVLAIIRCVTAADVRPSFVGSATIIALQMFAVSEHHDVPRFVFHKHAY